MRGETHSNCIVLSSAVFCFGGSAILFSPTKYAVPHRALGFEPKKEEIKKMIADIDKDGRWVHGGLAAVLYCS
jgi:hypothetical protein